MSSSPSRILPPALAARARAFVAETLEPVVPRPSATVVLLRDADRGLEAYLLRRRTSMAFAGGMYAFPGGSVDPRDADHAVRWAGPTPKDWAERFGTDEAAARAKVCAAVRETFEESGVLLAGPTPDSVVPDTTGTDWEADRAALVRHDLAFSDFLNRRGLVLRSDLLGAWGHWITPRFEERRFDTWFFVAALPAGQRTRDVSDEADRVAWMSPAVAVERATRGELAMLPPTWVTLEEIARHESVREVLAAATQRQINSVMPGWIDNGDRVEVLLPSDPQFPGDDPGDR